jgi:hypothetical protein
VLSIQATYAGLPDFLTQVVESELARIPRAFARYHPDQRWTIVYLPQACSLDHAFAWPCNNAALECCAWCIALQACLP